MIIFNQGLFSLFPPDYLINDCLVGLAIASSTAEQEVLGSIPGSDKVLGFSIRKFLRSNHGVWIYTQLMAIGSAPITWDLKNITGDMWVYHYVHLCLTLSGLKA